MPTAIPTVVATEPFLILRQVPVYVVTWVTTYFDRTWTTGLGGVVMWE